MCGQHRMFWFFVCLHMRIDSPSGPQVERFVVHGTLIELACIGCVLC